MIRIARAALAESANGMLISMEKLLKAIICSRSRELAPRMHNLVRLFEMCDIEKDEHIVETLIELSALNIEGRYPDALTPSVDRALADNYLAKFEEAFAWLKNQLPKA